jgi:hypothetical protein
MNRFPRLGLEREVVVLVELPETAIRLDELLDVGLDPGHDAARRHRVAGDYEPPGMTALPEPIERRDFVSAELMAGYRPAWGHPNKRVVYEIACPRGAVHRGNLCYSRWAIGSLPIPLLTTARTSVGMSAPTDRDHDPLDRFVPLGGYVRRNAARRSTRAPQRCRKAVGGDEARSGWRGENGARCRPSRSPADESELGSREAAWIRSHRI